MSRQRKHVSGAEKLAILKRHLVEKTPISDLCDEYGLQPSQIYYWQSQLFEHGAGVFERKPSRQGKAAELDGYSRYIVHWELRESMKEPETETVVQRALEKFPDARPRIISDNGPQFVARDFKAFIRLAGLTHVRRPGSTTT